jgi:AraC-like DNA-binding protein
VRTPMISLNAATGLIEAISGARGDPDQILHAVGLDRSTVCDPQGFLPCADFSRLLQEAARGTGDDAFGLHFGEQFQPKSIGPLIYVVLNSPTMAVAFDNAVRYLKVHNEGARVTFTYDATSGYLRQSLLGAVGDEVRQQSEYSMVVALNTLRLMAGSRWCPREVQFAHRAPAHTADHVRVFGAPLSFGSETNTLVIDRAFIDRQVPAADERLYPILRRYLDRVVKEMPREDRTLSSIRQVIGDSIREGDPKLDDVARRVTMSTRTLQRRLKEHGVDFKGLVDDTRRRFSLDYLADPAHTPAEIAYLLGYSEVSAFNRAFKRWTGTTPSTYRRRAPSLSPAG